MLKFIYLLLALATVANAYVRTVDFTVGEIIQGLNSSGVIVRQKSTDIEIKWLEDFGYKNSLKVYFNFVFENTGLHEFVQIDNLCDKYKNGTLENNVKDFILFKLGNTNTCRIRKGTKKVPFPVTFTYMSEIKTCGPVLVIFQILRNNKNDPNVTPLLFSFTIRGIISGPGC